jgi:hypothetical protein
MFEVTPSTRPQQVGVNEYGLKLAACEFCREPIAWVMTRPNLNARTPEGKLPKRMPIDPLPSSLGKLALTLRPGDLPEVGEFGSIGQAAGYRAAGNPTFIQHVKTCARREELVRGVKRKRTRK